MFRPLDIKQIREIVKIQLKKVGKMLQEYKLELVVSEPAIDWLAEHGYDPQSGARPVKRLIQKEIVNELSKEIIGGGVSGSDRILIDEKEGRLAFSREEM